MVVQIEKELDRLEKMTVPELRRRHQELFGNFPRSNHRQFLLRQMAWKIQATREGGLPEDVRQYAIAIARNCPLRMRVAANVSRRAAGVPLDNAITTKLTSKHDSRLPLAGSLVIKEFKGVTHVVKVLDETFEYDGRRFGSLSAIAQEISGTKWNGYKFFGLT